MRGVSGRGIVAVSVVVLLVLTVLASFGLAFHTPSALASNPSRTTAAAPVHSLQTAHAVHASTVQPAAAPPVNARFTITQEPPAVATDYFWVYFSMQVWNTTLDDSNVSLMVTAWQWNGTSPTMVAAVPFMVNTALVTPPNLWTPYSIYSDGVNVSYSFLNTSGFNTGDPTVTNSFVNWNYSLEFQLNVTNTSVGPTSNVSVFDNSTVFYIPPVTATLTLGSMPSSTTIPFTFTYTAAVTGLNPDLLNSSTNNATVIVTASNGSNMVAQTVAMTDPTTSSQSFTVDYAFLLSGIYGPQNLPGGLYTVDVLLVAENGFQSLSTSEVTSASITFTVIDGTVEITSAPTAYQTLPFNISYNISIGGNSGLTISSATVAVTLSAIWLGYVDPVSGQSCGSVIFGIPCPTIATQSLSFQPGVSSYTVGVTTGFMTSGNYSGSASDPTLLPVSNYQFVITATISNPSAPSAAAQVTTGAVSTRPVVTPASGTVTASQTAFGNVAGGVGNVSIVATYTGDFIQGANVTVTPVGSTTTVFVAGVFVPGAGVRSAQVTWPAAQNGSYDIVLTLATPYGNVTSSVTLQVNATGGAVVVTKTTYNNQTLVGGLSPGVMAAILIVVGLVVGMVVAMALGRSIWGGRPSAAPQPWAAGANECSVCHQKFENEAELKAHAKSAHGVE